ncbi:MAG: DUF3592 domain-containing protein [Azonexus sp.]
MSGVVDRIKRAMLPPILVIGGAFVIYLGVGEAETAKAMADHGKVAKAEVLSVHWKEKGISKREKGFQAEIHYLTEDKRDITTLISVGNELGQQLRDDKGQPELAIKYLPENPEKVVLANSGDNSSFMFGAGALMVAIGAGIFLYRRRQGRPEVAAESAA